jgi:hypothetical protein
MRFKKEGIRFEHEAGMLTRDERIALSRPVLYEMQHIVAEMRALVPARSNPALPMPK